MLYVLGRVPHTRHPALSSSFPMPSCIAASRLSRLVVEPKRGICSFTFGHIESHHPTQAKRRLEWGTEDSLPVWQKRENYLSTLSPVGTAESSPGRKSWVSKVPTSSPEGTAENIPGCNPGPRHSPMCQELYALTPTLKPPSGTLHGTAEQLAEKLIVLKGTAFRPDVHALQ